MFWAFFLVAVYAGTAWRRAALPLLTLVAVLTTLSAVVAYVNTGSQAWVMGRLPIYLATSAIIITVGWGVGRIIRASLRIRRRDHPHPVDR